MIRSILRAFNLGSDPIPTPFAKKKVEPKRDSIPDDVHHVRGQAFKTKQTDKDTFESERWTDSRLTRSDQLTDADRQAIEEQGLIEAKYAELKYLWSVYMTAEKAVREMKSRGYHRGYGLSTIEKYFGAMSKAHMTREASPLSVKRGEGVK